MRCKICGQEDRHQKYSVREMMFGTRETFEYFQCINCRCLQLLKTPEDLACHYPETYYSFSPFSGKITSRKMGLINYLRDEYMASKLRL